MIVAGDFNFPIGVVAKSGWMKRLQLHLLRPRADVPTVVTRNGASCNDFVLVSNVLHSRCQDAFVELEAGLLDHTVCCRVAHRGPMSRFLVLVMVRRFEICQEAFVQGLTGGLCL